MAQESDRWIVGRGSMRDLVKAAKEIIGEARTCVRALQESRYHTK